MAAVSASALPNSVSAVDSTALSPTIFKNFAKRELGHSRGRRRGVIGVPQEVAMRNFLLAVVTIFSATIVSAQQLAPGPNSTPSSSPDVEDLRQQVQALTETVKELKQQVKE